MTTPEAKRRHSATRQHYRRLRFATRTPEELARDRAELHPDGLKSCTVCARELPFHHFADTDLYRDGLTKSCSACFARRRAADEVQP